MLKYSAIIVDDEKLAINRLKKLLKEVPSVELLGETENPFMCLELIERHKPDVMFLDIQMPGLNGFELIQQLPANRLPMIIFTTAYDQYALKAFESLAIDYLLKPIKLSNLEKAISKIQSLKFRFEKSIENGASKSIGDNPFLCYTKRFVLKHGRRWSIVEENDIVMFFAEAKYCYLRSEGKDSIINFTLQELERKLDPEVFLRVHRSSIISRKYIRHIKSIGSGRYEITLKDGKSVNSSRYYSLNLKKKLHI